MTFEQLANKLKEKEDGRDCSLLSLLFSVSARYKSKELQATKQNIIDSIQYYPIISLKFDFPQWLKFYGKGNLNDWYSSHVICGVSIEDNYLTYFEPLAGKLRVNSFDEFEDIYNMMLVIR